MFYNTIQAPPPYGGGGLGGGAKQQLRQQITALKKEYKEQRAALSATVLAALEAHPAFKAAGTVLLYHSLPDEVDTHDFIRRWCGKKRIVLPVVVGDELELRLYTSEKDLAIGAYGIAEPVGDTFTDYSSIAFIAVPGVAFDRRGNRLGRGKGYYDRLLPRLPHARKVGICFPYQLVESVPAEVFDIRMDEVITASTIQSPLSSSRITGR